MTKKIMKEEGETEEENRHWKDADVEVMIALHGDMEPKVLKNAKKQGMLNFSMCSISKKKH